MIATIRVKYANGVLTPLEPLDLEEGRELVVSFNGARTAKGEEAGSGIRKARGGWKGLVDADELIRTIYADRLRGSKPAPEF